jgi:radical SAM superfamily enzyme YgiQ (UPF0313 family)
LGLCLIASTVADDFEVRVFDGMFENPAELIQVIGDFGPDYVGVSIRNIDDVVMQNPTFYIDHIRDHFIEPIRAACRAPLILGGSGYSLFPHVLLDLLEADFGIVGEGERAFKELISAIEQNRDPSTIQGVAIRGAKEKPISQALTDNPGNTLEIGHSNIDSFVNFAPYRPRSSYPVQTKRGCLHKCLYCSYPMIEGSCFRLRSPVAVVNEIESVTKRLGNITVEFVDSTFNDPPGHAESICQEIIRRGLRVSLRTMGVNPARITSELLSLMKKAGFLQIDCTPDTASPNMLRSMRKNFTRKRLEQAADWITRHQMPTMWFFVFGGPGESEETIKETFDFIDEFIDSEDLVHLTEGIRIYPGTGLYDIALKEGLIHPHENLLQPRFYVSPNLGRKRLADIIEQAVALRPNCVPASQSTPDPEMIQEALALKKANNLQEPMFRTLLRIRRSRMKCDIEETGFVTCLH